MKRTILALLIGGLFFGFGKRVEKSAPPNVILIIVDGMGLSQLSSLQFHKAHPAIERFPVVGLSKTSSSREKITDSAAGATALACGEKTYNGAIAVNDSGQALPTLVELLSQRGYSTGLIATSSITHATPACFYAHVESRRMEEDIALQLLDSPVDFFAGGGRQFFESRKDGQNLLNSSALQWHLDSLHARDMKSDKRQGFVLAQDGMPTVAEGRGDFLNQAVQLGVRHLREKQKPYFMMIEASQVDWGGHANEGDYIVQEMLDLDRMLENLLHGLDSNTLVVLTADHETGGFTLGPQRKQVPFGGEQDDYSEIVYGFSTGGHSAAMVPVLAMGSGSELFAGIYENTSIFHKIMQLTQP